MGGEGKTRTITDKDGAQIRINDEAKTATKMPAFGGGFGGGRPQINWNKLTDEVKKENNIKEVGKETIAGKETFCVLNSHLLHSTSFAPSLNRMVLVMLRSF